MWNHQVQKVKHSISSVNIEEYVEDRITVCLVEELSSLFRVHTVKVHLEMPVQERAMLVLAVSSQHFIKHFLYDIICKVYIKLSGFICQRYSLWITYSMWWYKDLNDKFPVIWKFVFISIVWIDWVTLSTKGSYIGLIDVVFFLNTWIIGWPTHDDSLWILTPLTSCTIWIGMRISWSKS